MTATFTIDLSPEEKALVAYITFDAPRDHADFQRNAQTAERLTNSLFERGGVPDHRQRYFTDADFNVGGRGTSRLGRFVRNGCQKADVPKHPHFLPYLRYFIFGANLPEVVRNEFKADVDACGWITSGDIDTLCKKARSLARRHGLSGSVAREEFYKLALDCGLSQGNAAFVRSAIMAVR